MLSHGRPDTQQLAQAITAANQRIDNAGPGFDTAVLRADLAQWQECEFGQWMLINGGWNGYWTRHAVSYPSRRAAGEPAPSNEVERFFLEKAPGIVGTQQRFQHFQVIFQELFAAADPSHDFVAASVPCGVMDDFLTLPQLPGRCTLIGLDLDPLSLELARQTARDTDRVGQVVLAKADAWDLSTAQVVAGDGARLEALKGQTDVLTSNGLNIYEPDDERVIELYESFRAALKKGGTLVTSALTPPREWDLSPMQPAEIKRAQGLLLINGVAWANYRSVELTTHQLQAAGLDVVETRLDRYRVYPTFVARAR